MSSYASQLHEEQQAVDRAYGRLDDLRAEMWQRLDTVRAAGSHGSPTQRSERDSFATMYENRLTQLRSVEDRLVFGRLDAKNGDRHYIGRIGLSLLFGLALDWGVEGFWWGNSLAAFISVFMGLGYYFFGHWEKRELMLKDTE